MSPNQRGRFNSNVELSMVRNQHAPISHPFPRRSVIINSNNTLRHGCTTFNLFPTVSTNNRNQIRMGTTVDNTLHSSSNNINYSSCSSRSSLSFNRPVNQSQVQLAPYRNANSTRRGRNAVECNADIIFGSINHHSFLFNEWDENSLSNNNIYNPSSRNFINVTPFLYDNDRDSQAEEQIDIMIECQICHQCVSHNLIDDHMFAHDLEASTNEENSTSSGTIQNISSRINENLQSDAAQDANGTRNPIRRTAFLDKNDLDILTETQWRGLARRRNAMWPFIRLNTESDLNQEDSMVNNAGSTFSRTTSTLERNSFDFSSCSNNDEISSSSNDSLICRTAQSNNGVNMNADSCNVGTSTTTNSYNYGNFIANSYGISPFTLSSNSTNSLCNEYNASLSSYRTTYDTCSTQRYFRNFNSSSVYPSVVQPHNAHSVNQQIPFSQSNYVYPIRSSSTTLALNDVFNNLPTPQYLASLFPTSVFDADKSSSLQETYKMCAICLEEYVTGDSQRRLPCAHVYHKSCIDKWLRKSSLCPTCKHNVTLEKKE